MPSAATGTVPSCGLLQMKAPFQAQAEVCRCAYSIACERLSARWLCIRVEDPLDRAVPSCYVLSPTTCHLLPVTGDLWRTPSHGVRPRCPVLVPYGTSDLLDIRGEGNKPILEPWCWSGFVRLRTPRLLLACRSIRDRRERRDADRCGQAGACRPGVYRRPAVGGWHDSRSLLLCPAQDAFRAWYARALEDGCVST